MINKCNIFIFLSVYLVFSATQIFPENSAGHDVQNTQHPVASEKKGRSYKVSDPSQPFMTVFSTASYDLTQYRVTAAAFAQYRMDHPFARLNDKDAQLPNCSKAEVDEIKGYASGSAYALNPILYNNDKGQVNGGPISAQDENEILILASALNCITQYNGSLYRGLDGFPENLKSDLVVGNAVAFPAFSSTSKDRKVAEHFAKATNKESILFVIRNGKGGDLDVTKLSSHPGEKEVLIPPGAVFKVLSAKIEPGPPILHIFEIEQSLH